MGSAGGFDGFDFDRRSRVAFNVTNRAHKKGLRVGYRYDQYIVIGFLLWSQHRKQLEVGLMWDNEVCQKVRSKPIRYCLDYEYTDDYDRDRIIGLNICGIFS